MFCEFIDLQDMPCFVTPADVSCVCQKKRSTNIHLKNGVKLIVRESAAEVKADIQNKLNETIMEQILNGSNANF